MNSALKNMLSSLSPLKLYELNADTLVYKELSVYAEGLDMLNQEIKRLHKECFVPTAESYGLDNREKIWGAAQNHLSVQERRGMVIKRLAMHDSDFTLLGMKNFLQALHMDAAIIEEPESFTVYVNCGNTKYTKAQRSWITKEINQFFPSHLEVFIDFRTITWEELDKKSMTFTQLDAYSYTWNDIEAYGI